MILENKADIVAIISELNKNRHKYDRWLHINLSKTNNCILLLFPSPLSGKTLLPAYKEKKLGNPFLLKKSKGFWLL